MSTANDIRTPGARLASLRMDAAIERAIRGEETPYPYDATFVGADVPGIGEILKSCARERNPVVLVFPDGEERIIDYLPSGPRRRGKGVLRRLRRRG